MYVSFRLVRGQILTVLEMVEAMRESDPFDMFSEFSKVIYISVFCGTIIQCVAQIENLPPQHHSNKGNNVINIEGPTQQSTMKWERRFFLLICSVSSYDRFICTIFSLHMQVYVSVSYDPLFFSDYFVKKIGQLAGIFWAKKLSVLKYFLDLIAPCSLKKQQQ